MAQRNQKARSLAWTIARSKQIALAVERCGWVITWVWTNIIASVDHFGRMDGGSYSVRDLVFGMFPGILPEDVEQYLVCLEEVGLIIRYEANNCQYIQLPKIGKYQKINGNMAEESDYPVPPEAKINDWKMRFGDEYFPMVIRKIKSKTPPSNEVETIIQYWNSKGRLAKANHVNRERLDKGTLRLQSEGFRENWKKAIDKVAESAFCCGQGRNGWKATIDWFFANDSNWVKAVEGKYDDRRLMSAVDEWIRGSRKSFD